MRYRQRVIDASIDKRRHYYYMLRAMQIFFIAIIRRLMMIFASVAAMRLRRVMPRAMPCRAALAI